MAVRTESTSTTNVNAETLAKCGVGLARVGALDCVLYFAPLINYLEANVIEVAAAPTEIIPKGLRIAGDALAIFTGGEGQWDVYKRVVVEMVDF